MNAAINASDDDHSDTSSTSDNSRRHGKESVEPKRKAQMQGSKHFS